MYCRWIELPGCVNLRDVGGHATRGGATLAWGRLFRGAAPTQVDPAVAMQLVRDVGIRRVLDLRTGEEVREEGVPRWPPDCEHLHVPLFTSIQAHWPNPIDRTPPSTARLYFEMLQAGTPALGRIVALLATPPARPTLIHCAAGRDRTGIVIACLLDLLGVPEEVIAVDYALSEVVDDAEKRNADPENILLLLKLIREHYGSTREMLVGHGVPERAIDGLGAALFGG